MVFPHFAMRIKLFYVISVSECKCLVVTVEAPTTPAPPRLSYNMAVKLVNLGEGFKAPAPGSKGYDVLANTITSGFHGVLAKVPGFHKLQIEEFTE